MRLTPWEEERLLIFTAAELARRHRAAGLALNAPEVIALICDAMLEAARAGESYKAVEEAGRAAVDPADVMVGVRELIDDVRLEILMDDGARLVVLVDPLGSGGLPPEVDGPGAIRPAADRPADAGDVGFEILQTLDMPARETRDLTVRSESRRVIRVSSHYPFHRVNARLVFDREAASGFRLDMPSGASERWSPGETRTVRLVRFGGSGGEDRDGADDQPAEDGADR